MANCLIRSVGGAVKKMKAVELRLISELMKNSRRSDRELAKTIGTSQPTVSRTIQKLEEQGIIKEYTMIPDFRKLGFQMLTFTFVKLIQPIPENAFEETRKAVREKIMKRANTHILAMNGMGCGADGVVVAFHENYSSYVLFMDSLKDHPLVKVDELKSFIVNLQDETHFRNLTFAEIAKYVAQMQKKT